MGNDINMSERLRAFIDYTRLKDSEFARTIDSSKQQISDWTKGKKIPIAKVTLLLETYKELNGNWFLTGKGNMLKGENGVTLQKKECMNPDCCEEKDELREEIKKQRAEIDDLKMQVIRLQAEKIKWLEEKK